MFNLCLSPGSRGFLIRALSNYHSKTRPAFTIVKMKSNTGSYIGHPFHVIYFRFRKNPFVWFIPDYTKF